MMLANDVDLGEFVMMKDKLSGADIEAVCTKAGLSGVTNSNNIRIIEQESTKIITHENLENGVNVLMPTKYDRENQDLHNRMVKVYSTKSKLSKKGTKNILDPELLRSFVPPTNFDSDSTCSFRNVMYGRGPKTSTIYHILNHLPSKKFIEKSIF
ncbi:hypothetical protein Pst134EA_011813 [Puccinia striiformis f. sp. tritici]|uniref:hypothetical protein n=1 Tax=Puccinia striiformis f. sp. tritici TaxID=168172 RepID=UPI002007C991|nr:hypothetical protein Pst134EA_011813 [Puccinia striiformis f. sp. tritici]KAH9456544.1 hypothetical protein Pst134EB_012744 [Puccinia striiformis f. sp. tritici]KAH9468184.1 hypothetical protein Pst134EA_011813 [Puccinia striiformis f. sp. tritici]